jgi:hypothetical protein
MRNYPESVFAVFPTRTGFGWVLFEGPTNPVDWGVATIARERNKSSLLRVDALLDELKPKSLVLEQFEGPGSRRADRIQQLCRDILDLANTKGMDAHVYGHADIRTSFEEVGARSRYEIATAIASRIDDFAHELPPKRKIWLPEDPRMGLFNAAAVALTHYGHL